MTQSTTTTVSAPWYFRRNFRLVLLVSILIFELVFIRFIKQSGWLKTVDLSTQIGVYALALSPLLIALLFLVRRQIKLSSLLIAMGLLAVFFSFAFKPVFEARSQKMVVFNLAKSGIEYENSIVLSSKAPSKAEITGHRPSFPPWVDLILGKKLAFFPYPSEICSITVYNDEQLKSLKDVQLPELKALHISSHVSKETINTCRNTILNFRPAFLNFGFTKTPPQSTSVDIQWLEDAESMAQLALCDVIGSPNAVAALELPNLQWLAIEKKQGSEEIIGWDKFFQSPTIKNLHVLSLKGYSSVTDRHAKLLSEITDIRVLYLLTSITDYQFLNEMKALQSVFIDCPAIRDEDLLAWTLPDWITSGQINIPATTLPETLEQFKKNNPAVSVQLRTIVGANRFITARTAAESK